MVWKKGFDTFEIVGDFWQEFEGKSEMSPVQEATDLENDGSGQQITFTVVSEMYAEPHMGDQLFETSAHFEELKSSSNAMVIDWFRHGIRFTQRTASVMGWGGEMGKYLAELQQGANKKLGGWTGRLKSEQLFMMFVAAMPANNLITFGGGLVWDQIITNGQYLKRLGATPCIVGRSPSIVGQQSAAPIRKFIVVACTDALTTLELDAQYRNILTQTRDPAGSQYIFSGGYTPVRGHIIKEYEVPTHDGYGAIGSPLNPQAYLGTAISGATNIKSGTPLYIVGGGTDFDPANILIKPMKYLPNYAYPFQPGTLNPSNGNLLPKVVPTNTPFYVAIHNPPNAVTDPNKWGLYQCTLNDGVQLTVTRALVDGTTIAAAAASGGSPALVVSFGTVGNTTTGAGGTAGIGSVLGTGTGASQVVQGIGNVAGWAWNGAVNSNTHPQDALVYLVGVDGIALFYSLMLGAAAVRRGYGMYRGERGTEQKEAGFIRELYSMSVFGQNFRTNRKNKLPGALTFLHQGQYAGTKLPTP